MPQGVEGSMEIPVESAYNYWEPLEWQARTHDAGTCRQSRCLIPPGGSWMCIFTSKEVAHV